MSRLVLWKVKISHLEFSGAPSCVGLSSSSLVWGLFLILIPSSLGHPVWRKRVRYPHPEGICPFLTGSVGQWSSGIPSTKEATENIPESVKFLSLTSACQVGSPRQWNHLCDPGCHLIVPAKETEA